MPPTNVIHSKVLLMFLLWCFENVPAFCVRNYFSFSSHSVRNGESFAALDFFWEKSWRLFLLDRLPSFSHFRTDNINLIFLYLLHFFGHTGPIFCFLSRCHCFHCINIGIPVPFTFLSFWAETDFHIYFFNSYFFWAAHFFYCTLFSLLFPI